MGEAEAALSLLRALLSGGPANAVLKNGDVLQKVLAGALYWIHFRTNPADKRAREAERDFMLWLVGSEPARAESYLEVLKPWTSSWDVGAINRGARELQYKLLTDLTLVVLPFVTDSALDLFSKAGGISRLREKGRMAAQRYALFSRDSPVRSGALRQKLIATLARAESESVIHDNCIEFFQLLLSGMRGAQDGATLEDFRSVPQDTEMISAIWKSVIARKIQYRMQADLLKGRQQLVDAGTPETVLPIPEWLVSAPAREF